jgi:hypothetical protein
MFFPHKRQIAIVATIALSAGLILPASALPPSNDDFADADPISEGIEKRTDTREATSEIGEAACGTPTTWWRFTAPAAGDYVTYATGGNFDTEIGWSSDLGTTSGECPDDGDDSYDAVESALSLASGEVEYVHLGGNSSEARGTAGVGVARVHTADDAFAARSALAFRSGAPSAVRGVGFDGTEGTEVSEPTACGGATAFTGTAWLSFTPPTTGAWFIEAKYNQQISIAVYSGSSLGSLSLLACSMGERNAVALDLSGGTTYVIQLENDEDAETEGVVRAEYAGMIRGMSQTVDLDGDGTSTDVGLTSSAALIDGIRPAIAYYDITNRELRFAERNAGGVWSDVLVDADGDGTSTKVGEWMSLSILSNGQPAIAYYDNTNKELRFAERNAGGVWSDVLVDADGDGTSTMVGSQMSLIILSNGQPAIAYYDNTNSELRFAERNAGGVWSDVLVDADGDGTSSSVGEYLDAILFDGSPILAFADAANTEMRLAERSGAVWSDSLVLGSLPLNGGDDTEGANGQPSLAIAPDGRLALAIQDYSTGHSHYGKRSSSGVWTMEEILTDRFFAELGWAAPVVLNYGRDGKPVIHWSDNNYGGHVGVSVKEDGMWSEQIGVPFLLDPRDPNSTGEVSMFSNRIDAITMPDGRIGWTSYDSDHDGLYWQEDRYRVCPTGATPFADMSATSFAKDDVPCIFGLGVTTGTSATTYSPADFVTREQMASFLARMYRELTGEECSGGAHPFTDMSATSFAKDDVPCIFGLGITTGTSATTYSPADFVTREQMASFLARVWRTEAVLA